MLHTSRPTTHTSSRTRDTRILVLNVVIVVLTLIVGYLAYALIARNVIEPPVVTGRAGAQEGETIQLDVLNGCGISGAAQTVTSYLRARGYDVVEMKNYKTFDVQHSLVVDRRGNRKTAEQVAYALGVREENIVAQLSQDYYVDVSVVVGKDFSSLKPAH
jgi:LytR cell envelope-related transcriptional attenuator